MKKFASAVLLSAIAAAPAFAADQGPYVNVDVGQVSYSGANTAGNPSFANPGAINFGGGYHFNQYIGVEGGYTIIGDSTINYLNATETLKASALQAAAVGTFPINDKVDLYGKLGLANTKLDYTLTGFGLNGSGSATSTNVMLGIGGQFNINRHFGIRAQYVNYGKTKFTPTVNGVIQPSVDVGVSIFSVGGVFNF